MTNILRNRIIRAGLGLILGIGALTASLASCGNQAEAKHYLAIGNAGHGFFTVATGNDSTDARWGLINANGLELIAPQYSMPLEFKGDYAIAITDGKQGVVNLSGNTVIPCSHEHISLFDGYALVTDGGKTAVCVIPEGSQLCTIDNSKFKCIAIGEGLVLAIDEATGKYGFLTLDGTPAIPFEYEEALPFSNGMAAVRVGESVRFIDHNGDKAFPKEFKYMHYDSPETSLQGFSEGLAIVYDSRGHAGAIDTRGNVVIPFQYNGIEDFSNGHAIALMETYDGSANDGLHDMFTWNLLDTKGNIIGTLRNDDYYINYDNESRIKVNYGGFDEDSYVTFVTPSGTKFDGKRFKQTVWFRDGHALVILPGEKNWSVIDASGNVVLHGIADTTSSDLLRH